MTREQAAVWLGPFFPEGITPDRLRHLAARRSGPKYIRNGRRALYREADLKAWVDSRLQQVEQDQAA